MLVCGKLYGRLADVLKTRNPYKVPAPMEKDFLPELQQPAGEPALSQSQKDKLFERAYDERYYAKVDKIFDQKPNMYFTLLASIGKESKTV